MLIVIFLLGLVFGSFANVLIDRLPQGQSVLLGRSHCDFCGKKLSWYELIPVAAFLIQSGRCRHCHKILSLQYPLIELTTAVGLVTIYQLFNYSFILLFAYSFIFFSLLVIFVTDFKYQIIPDSMVILGVMGAIGANGARVENLVSAVGAAAFFYFLYVVTRARGMGLGDVKLACFLGFLAGFPKIVVAFYIAFLTGAMVGVILILLAGKSLKSKIAFGPFLIIGAVTALVWGEKIISWFFRLV